MKKSLIIAVPIVILVIVVVVLFQNVGSSSQDNPYELTRLPDSPLFASYKIDDREVALTDGVADGVKAGLTEGEQINVLGTPIFGDVNGDERDDAIVLLTYTNNTSVTQYYVALALKDSEGFLGINALRLKSDNVPQQAMIRDEFVEIKYTETGTTEDEEVQETVPPQYFKLLGISLSPVDELSDGEQIEQGMYVYGHESRVFTPCNTDTTYWLSPESNSLAALEAIYIERTRSSEPYTPIYIVLSGFVTDSSTDGFAADFDQSFIVTGILSVPKKGSCEL